MFVEGAGSILWPGKDLQMDNYLTEVALFILFSFQSKWTREESIQRRQQQVDVIVLKVDASHNLARFEYVLLALVPTQGPSIALARSSTSWSRCCYRCLAVMQ